MEKPDSEYIELLKKMLCDYHRVGRAEYKSIQKTAKLLHVLDKILRARSYAISKIVKSDIDKRINGQDWPVHADTMIGMKRLNNIEYCVRDIVKNNVRGDFIELGVWRGGAVILMRALLKVMNIADRNVWVADSFQGLPHPNPGKYPADKGDKHWKQGELSVSEEDVRHNFEKYGLLDEQVKFLKGWFKDTLPVAPIKNLALLRLDGDMYESTMDGLVNLYPKLSAGGYIIIDDWGAVPACKKAVEDYRNKYAVKEEIIPIDWTGIYWKKLN